MFSLPISECTKVQNSEHIYKLYLYAAVFLELAKRKVTGHLDTRRLFMKFTPERNSA